MWPPPKYQLHEKSYVNPSGYSRKSNNGADFACFFLFVLLLHEHDHLYCLKWQNSKKYLNLNSVQHELWLIKLFHLTWWEPRKPAELRPDKLITKSLQSLKRKTRGGLFQNYQYKPAHNLEMHRWNEIRRKQDAVSFVLLLRSNLFRSDGKVKALLAPSTHQAPASCNNLPTNEI